MKNVGQVRVFVQSKQQPVCVCVYVSDKVAINADPLLSDLNETAVLVSNPTQS